jgi:hypothetical protein
LWTHEDQELLSVASSTTGPPVDTVVAAGTFGRWGAKPATPAVSDVIQAIGL